jgi:uncharacterized protein (TIGR00251 family)
LAAPAYVRSAGPGVWTADIRVQPGARKSAVEGLLGSRLKLRIAAPAVEGKANKAVVEFLAGVLKVKKSQVSILRGESSREKTVRVEADAPQWP